MQRKGLNNSGNPLKIGLMIIYLKTLRITLSYFFIVYRSLIMKKIDSQVAKGEKKNNQKTSQPPSPIHRHSSIFCCWALSARVALSGKGLEMGSAGQCGIISYIMSKKGQTQGECKTGELESICHWGAHTVGRWMIQQN